MRVEGKLAGLLLLVAAQPHVGAAAPPAVGTPPACEMQVRRAWQPAAAPSALHLRLRGGDGDDEAKKSFNLDAFKRLYSNTDDTASIMPQFWTDFEAEEPGKFSLWFVNYKNNAEYTKKLMACNLIGGWFQRLDGTGTRKVAFGTVHVFGETGQPPPGLLERVTGLDFDGDGTSEREPDLEIAGVFLVAGNEIPKEFQEVDDFEQWEWVLADSSDTAQRQVIEDFWKWDGDFKKPDGTTRTWLNGKTYK